MLICDHFVDEDSLWMIGHQGQGCLDSEIMWAETYVPAELN